MSCADLTWFKILRGFVGALLSCALLLLRAFVCALLSARFCLARFCYGADFGILYRRHIAMLDQFHLRCLRNLAHIRWQDMILNTTVLERCEISDIESSL